MCDHRLDLDSLKFCFGIDMIPELNTLLSLLFLSKLCIFYTIKEFGPVVFTLIMTTRQMISICVSAVMFGHSISFVALIGAGIVFGILFYQIRRKYLARKAQGSQVNKPLPTADPGAK